MSKKMYRDRNKLFLTSKHSPTAEVIERNVDLLTELLLRVPIKSLIKFKCVSRHWLSLISDPQFASNHTRRNHRSLISGVYFYTKRHYTLPLNDQVTRVSVGSHHRKSLPTFSFLDGSGSTPTLRHSSNGLMLCQDNNWYGDRVFIVCNLTTQKFKALAKPRSRTSSKSYREHGSYLIYDPTKSPYYKVVSISCSYEFKTCQMDIYFSESGSWKNMCFTPSISSSALGAVWNGAIIWMSCEDWTSCARHGHVYFRLDIDAEKLTTTRVPRDPNLLSKGILYFGECGGNLLLIQRPSYSTRLPPDPNLTSVFRVLEMDKDSYCWNVKYQVDLTPLILPNRSTCQFYVVNLLEGAKENDLTAVLYIRGKVISYNLEYKTLKVLCDKSPGNIESYTYKYSYKFIESLSPV